MQTEGGGEGGEMIKKHLFKSAVFLFMFAGVAAAIFYFESRITPNFGENIFESAKLEPSIKTEKIVSADLPIIRINDEVVYYPEFEFYLLATKKDYETILGDGVWNLTRNGRSVEELLKTDIIEEIARLKIVVNEAAKEGCSLTGDEAEEIKKTAADQLKGIDPILKARYYLDEELITGIYEENFLATKFFNAYSEKAGVEGEEAKSRFNAAYNIWESSYSADIYWENINGIAVGSLELVGGQ